MKNRAIPWNNNLKKEGETMDVSGEVADLMVKESIQITEESVKLLAAGKDAVDGAGEKIAGGGNGNG